MPEALGDSWRIQLGVRPGCEDPIPQAVLRSTPRSDVFVGDRSVILYPGSEAEARLVLSEQAQDDDVVWVELSRWDTEAASWRTVEALGRRADSTATAAPPQRWKPGTWPLMVVVFASTAAIMFLLAFFVPRDGRDHDAVASIAVAIFVGLICVGGSLWTTRRYEPPPP